MKFRCPGCRELSEVFNRFCHNCNYQFYKNCDKCSHVVLYKANYCRFCGNPLHQLITNEEQEKNKERKKPILADIISKGTIKLANKGCMTPRCFGKFFINTGYLMKEDEAYNCFDTLKHIFQSFKTNVTFNPDLYHLLHYPLFRQLVDIKVMENEERVLMVMTFDPVYIKVGSFNTENPMEDKEPYLNVKEEETPSLEKAILPLSKVYLTHDILNAPSSSLPVSSISKDDLHKLLELYKLKLSALDFK